MKYYYYYYILGKVLKKYHQPKIRVETQTQILNSFDGGKKVFLIHGINKEVVKEYY